MRVVDFDDARQRIHDHVMCVQRIHDHALCEPPSSSHVFFSPTSQVYADVGRSLSILAEEIGDSGRGPKKLRDRLVSKRALLRLCPGDERYRQAVEEMFAEEAPPRPPQSSSTSPRGGAGSVGRGAGAETVPAELRKIPLWKAYEDIVGEPFPMPAKRGILRGIWLWMKACCKQRSSVESEDEEEEREKDKTEKDGDAGKEKEPGSQKNVGGLFDSCLDAEKTEGENTKPDISEYEELLEPGFMHQVGECSCCRCWVAEQS